MASVRQLFGTTLRKLREDAGLTQEDVADRADVHWTYLSQIENGKRNPGLENIVYLAKAIGVTPAELLAAFTKSYMTNLKEKRARHTRAK